MHCLQNSSRHLQDKSGKRSQIADKHIKCNAKMCGASVYSGIQQKKIVSISRGKYVGVLHYALWILDKYAVFFN